MSRKLAALSAVAIVVAAAAALTSTGPGARAAPRAEPPSGPTATAAACDDVIFVRSPGRWRCRNMYMARVALDGRKQPNDDRRGAERNMLRAGEWVNIRCQIWQLDPHTGKRLRLYDRVGDRYVPDQYMRTYFTGRIPRSPICDL